MMLQIINAMFDNTIFANTLYSFNKYTNSNQPQKRLVTVTTIVIGTTLQ